MVLLNQNYPIYFLTILFYLLPVALVTGPFLSDLFLIIIALYSFINIFFYKKYYLLNNALSKYFGIFYLILILSSLGSIDALFSLSYDGAVFYFRYLFFIISVKLLYQNNNKLFSNFFKIALITSVVLVIDGTYQLNTGYNLIGWKINYRVSSFFKEELIIGVFLSKICILIFIYYFFHSSIKILPLLYMLLILTFILFTRERSASVLYMIFIFSFFTLYNFNNIKKILLCYFLFITFAVILIISSEYLLSYLLITINELDKGYIPLLFLPQAYEGLILSSINILFNNNLFFGNGPNSFRLLCLDYSFNNYCTSHPHSYYFQILIDMGIVGLLYFLFLFSLAIKFLLNSLRKYFKSSNIQIKLHIYFLMISILNFIPIVPSMNLYNNWTNVMLFIPISISYALYKSRYK